MRNLWRSVLLFAVLAMAFTGFCLAEDESVSLQFENPIVSNDRYTLQISGETAGEAGDGALLLHVEIRSHLSLMTHFYLKGLRVNNGKTLEDNTVRWSKNLEKEESASLTMRIDAGHLYGQENITEISLDLAVGFDINDMETLTFQVKNGNISAILPEKDWIAETTVNGIRWQLRKIGLDENGDLSLSMRLINESGETFTPSFEVQDMAVNGIQLDGGHFAYNAKLTEDILDGQACMFPVTLQNTAAAKISDLDGYELTRRYEENEYLKIALTDRILQRHGIKAVENLTWTYRIKDSDVSVQLTLPEPWLLPDLPGRETERNEYGVYWYGALPAAEQMDQTIPEICRETDAYQMRVERVFLSRAGAVLLLEVTNKTDRILEMSVSAVLQNQRNLSYDTEKRILYESTVALMPGAVRTWPILFRETRNEEQRVEELTAAIRDAVYTGANSETDHRDAVLTVTLPENTGAGMVTVEAADCRISVKEDAVPQSTELFEYEVWYVCDAREKNGKQANTDGIGGKQRYILFHADGTAEYSLDGFDEETSPWMISGNQIWLNQEGTGLVITADSRGLTSESYGEKMHFRNMGTETPAPVARTMTPPIAERKRAVSQDDMARWLVVAVIILILIGLLLRKNRKKREEEERKKALQQMKAYSKEDFERAKTKLDETLRQAKIKKAEPQKQAAPVPPDTEEKQRKLPEYVRGLKRVYVIHASSLEGRYPSIDIRGCVHVFGSGQQADDYCQANKEMKFTVREYDQKGFMEEVVSWCGLGITRLMVHQDQIAESGMISRDELLPSNKKLKDWNCYGSALSQMILRFLQAAALEKEPSMKETAATFWSFIAHELPQTVFLAPMLYEGETGDGIADRELHATVPAGKLLLRKTVEAMLGKKIPEKNAEIQLTDKEGKPVQMGADIDLFYGNERLENGSYTFAKKADSRRMMPLTLRQNGKTWMCGCTDFAAWEAVREIYGGKARLAAFTYDELTAFIEGRTEDPSEEVAGLVINPRTTTLFLEKKNIEDLKELSAGPVKVYMPKNAASPAGSAGNQNTAVQTGDAGEKSTAPQSRPAKPVTLEDEEAWRTRDISGKYLRKAADLKPMYRHLGEKDFYRIDYLTVFRMSWGLILQIIEALQEEATGVQLFVSSSVSGPLRRVESMKDMESEGASAAVAAQFRPGMAPMMVRLFNQTAIIQVRVFLRANLQLNQKMVDEYLEEVLGKVLEPKKTE